MDASPELLLTVSGALMCAGAVWQLASGAGSAARRRGRRRRHAEQWRRAFLERVEATAAAARARRSDAPGWRGKRPLRVAAIADEARDLKSFYLTPTDDDPLSGFLPGQYLTLSAKLPGDDKPTVRCYSLSDRPREEYYRLTIKREGPDPARPGSKPGRFSGWMHDHVRVGDVIECEAPRGAFFLNPVRRRGPFAGASQRQLQHPRPLLQADRRARRTVDRGGRAADDRRAAEAAPLEQLRLLRLWPPPHDASPGARLVELGRAGRRDAPARCRLHRAHAGLSRPGAGLAKAGFRG